ncbi:aldehyde dehydrogenase family protein, partial [Pseudomonas sp. MAFF 311096]
MLKNRLQDPSLLAELAYVDGQWIAADSAATLDIRDPATGHVLAQVPAMDAVDTRRAIEAAERAWPAWRARPAAERAALLERWYQAMIDNLDDLALIMTCEQ